MKKLFSIVLCLLLMLSFLACGGESKKEDDKSVNNNQAEISREDIVYLDASGESVYTIIRPAEGEMEEGACTSLIFKQLKEKLGISVRNTSDENTGTDVYEILVGATNRPESAQALQILDTKTGARYNDYIICSIGKKIVINAYNAEVLYEACKYFADNFLVKEGVKGGIEYTYAKPGEWKTYTVNGVNIGKFSIVRPHYNTSQLTQVEIDALVDSVYKATGYMLKVKEDAYTQESDYEIVVGNTNRSGVEKLTDSDLYNVKIADKKVYLNGGNTYSTAMAVSEFAKLCEGGTVTEASSVKNGSYSATYTAKYDTSKTYRPVWADDFEGNEVDTTKWDIIDEEYTKKDDTTGKSGQNGKRAWRKPENVLIYDGYFHSVFTQDDGNYYSGTLRTYTTMTFKYGYVEMSSITPKGSGFWSTLWMSSANVKENTFQSGYSMEVDIAENFGNAAVTDANAHVWPKGVGTSLGYEHRSFDDVRANESKYSVQKTDGKLLSEDFHTFGYLWTEDYIAFTADGKIYCDLNLNEPGFEDYKAAYTENLVNLRLAGTAGFCNCPLPMEATDEEWANTNQFIVDYVHLYQLDGTGSQLNVLK